MRRDPRPTPPRVLPLLPPPSNDNNITDTVRVTKKTLIIREAAKAAVPTPTAIATAATDRRREISNGVDVGKKVGLPTAAAKAEEKGVTERAIATRTYAIVAEMLEVPPLALEEAAAVTARRRGFPKTDEASAARVPVGEVADKVATGAVAAVVSSRMMRKAHTQEIVNLLLPQERSSVERGATRTGRLGKGCAAAAVVVGGERGGAVARARAEEGTGAGVKKQTEAEWTTWSRLRCPAAGCW